MSKLRRSRYRDSLARRMSAIAAACMLGYPLASPALEPSDYRLVDSGIATIGVVPASAWLDDERVVFWGKDQSKIVKGKPFPDYERPAKLNQGWAYWSDQFIWNVRTGEIERPARPMHQLCAYKGVVTYLSEEPSSDPAKYWYTGALGREIRLPPSKQHWLNPHSCRFYTTNPPWDKARESGHIPRPLLEEHGYIDMGPDALPRAAGYPVLISRDQPNAPVELPALWIPNRSWSFRYVPHANAYVVEGGGEPPLAFLMKPNGELTRAMFPPRSPRSAGPILHTKEGFFYRNLSGRNNVEDTKTVGGYLLTGTRLSRIVIGVIDGVSVSPDGCRIAFSHAPSAKAHYDGLEGSRRGGVGNTTMKMVDVCKAGRKQI